MTASSSEIPKRTRPLVTVSPEMVRWPAAAATRFPEKFFFTPSLKENTRTRRRATTK